MLVQKGFRISENTDGKAVFLRFYSNTRYSLKRFYFTASANYSNNALRIETTLTQAKIPSVIVCRKTNKAANIAYDFGILDYGVIISFNFVSKIRAGNSGKRRFNALPQIAAKVRFVKENK